MTPLRFLAVAASLAVPLLPVAAHHETAGSRQYLAFWSGYQAPASTPGPVHALCLEGRYWEKGFVSIYSHGPELPELR